jgi:hypothetical protein
MTLALMDNDLSHFTEMTFSTSQTNLFSAIVNIWNFSSALRRGEKPFLSRYRYSFRIATLKKE